MLAMASIPSTLATPPPLALTVHSYRITVNTAVEDLGLAEMLTKSKLEQGVIDWIKGTGKHDLRAETLADFYHAVSTERYEGSLNEKMSRAAIPNLTGSLFTQQCARVKCAWEMARDNLKGAPSTQQPAATAQRGLT